MALEEKNQPTEPKAQTPVAQEATTPVKTYTEEEVEQIKKDTELSVRKEALHTVVEKNTELRGELLNKGSDEFFDFSKWEVMKKMAEDMIKSGALPKADNAYTVMMKMQAGREMGMKPIEAINSLYVVNGVMSIWGKAVTKRIRNHGWSLKYEDGDDEVTVTATKGDESYSQKFTFKMAEESGWTKGYQGTLKPGWIKGANRTLKLSYGALSMLIKRYIPEVMDNVADIAEIAVDTVPVIQGESAPAQVPGATEPATSDQITSIQNLGGTLPDDGQITKGEAAQMIKDLTLKRKTAKKQEGSK